MNFESYNKVEKTQSKRCYQGAGGSSNFSFGWNEENNSNNQNMKINQNMNTITGGNNQEKMSVNIVQNEEDKENVNINQIVDINQIQDKSNFLEFNDNSKKASIKTDYASGRANFNVFTSESNYVDKSSSIKINQQPGGKSSVFFGDDTTSYNDYRRKR